MKRIHLDKIASATASLDISPQALISDEIVSAPGYVLAVRALDRKNVYNQIETLEGRMVRVYPGDVIAGVLGHRRALHGHAGVVPMHLTPGQIIHLLNLGGVIGQCTSSNPQVGPPLRVEVLGSVLHFPVIGTRQGVPAHIKMNALPAVKTLGASPPVVFISGTCMNSGKTLAACEVVRYLAGRKGLKVGVAKLTGVSLRRDTLSMLDCGATRALSFTDAGYPSTDAQSAPEAARAVLGALCSPADEALDVIVAELGDGLLGEYGVLPILEQPDVLGRQVVHVCCAVDPVGAFGAASIFKNTLKSTVDVFAGPVTDNLVGRSYIESGLGVAARNAHLDPEGFGQAVFAALGGDAPALTTEAHHKEPHHVAV